MKRKVEVLEENSDSDNGSTSFVGSHRFGNEIDISSALTNVNDGGRATAMPADDDDEEFIRKTMEQRYIKDGTKILKKTKSKGHAKMAPGQVGGGSFQSMGFHPSLLRSLTIRGYRVPTPIQRLSIPVLLGNPPRDLVGMARTGSGKTLAYMVPLIQRLGGQHGTTFGARALVLLPARELALQVLKVGKELARGWNAAAGGEHAGDVDSDDETAQPQNKKGQSLRWGLVVGGESIEEQFEMVSGNPDVIIATPGRLLHLIVEMNLDLRAVQYIVFDEADRLFEMGFATALNEILHRLPTNRQTLLFSATLPKSLVEFAKAGLQNPKLVRLDSESKISGDLRMAFFSVKQAEKEAALLTLLRDVIQVPLGSPSPQDDGRGKSSHKWKGKAPLHAAPHQALIFVATKHHVEYLATLLTVAGYSVSHIYGSLDQTARTIQMDQFRRGLTNLLVVTDVAARGIDIPVLENVVNYDFPQGARVFVHRVGRTARAGRKGWAWSFFNHTELPHLLDLQLFLGRPLKTQVPTEAGESAFVDSLVIGPFDRDRLDQDLEYLKALHEGDTSLDSLRNVMAKGQSMYERSQGKASQASYQRAKEMVKDRKWALAGTAGGDADFHPVFALKSAPGFKDAETEEKRRDLLRAVNSFRPVETVFEVGTRGNTTGAILMKDRRKALSKAVNRAKPPSSTVAAATDDNDIEPVPSSSKDTDLQEADESEIEACFGVSKKPLRDQNDDFRDSEFYMSYEQKDAHTEKGYSLRDGASFAEQAQGASFGLTTDEAIAERKRRDSQLSWDKKKKKFVKGGGVGADNVKMVKTESGARLPATYRSGRYDDWKQQNKVALPKVGEAELARRPQQRMSFGQKKFKHTKVTEAKPLDKFSTSYDRKMRQKKQAASSGDRGEDDSRPIGKPGANGKKTSRYGTKPIAKVKNELKTVAHIRKSRETLERRKAKNSRPTKGFGKGKRR